MEACGGARRPPPESRQSEEIRTMIVFPLMVRITIAKTRDGWQFAIHLALMI